MTEDVRSRKIMIMAMEFIIRTVVEDEDIYMDWLENGVPDAMIPYKSFNTSFIDNDDWMISDEGFLYIYKTFIRCMKEHEYETYGYEEDC